MVENGVRKKTPTYRNFARKCSWRIMCFQFAPSRHALWFTYIFAFDSRSLSIAAGWRKCGTLLVFLSTCSTHVTLAAPGITRRTSKRICRFTLSQKTRNWPTCKLVDVHEPSHERQSSFDPATLSTTWLSWSLASEARRLDAHIHGKLGGTLSPLTKNHILPIRPCCSLNHRSEATVPSRESANVFAQVTLTKRTTKGYMAVRKSPDGWVLFVFRRTKTCLGKAQALLRGSGGMLPRKFFGKMEPNSAFLCILAVKTEWLQHSPLTKSTQKLKKK